MIIVITGPQASGKGTVAEQLTKSYGWVHISAGEMLRREVRIGSTLGKHIRTMLAKGSLIDDKVVVNILKARMKKPDAKRGVILDGVPRDLAQAKMLNKISTIDCVIDLEISDAVAVRRISGRTECEKCGTTYGSNVKPKKKGICDKDGGKLVRREDDNPKAVRARLKTYHKRTQPILKLYGDKVHRIDASGKVDAVMKDVKKAIKSCRAIAR